MKVLLVKKIDSKVDESGKIDWKKKCFCHQLKLRRELSQAMKYNREDKKKAVGKKKRKKKTTMLETTSLSVFPCKAALNDKIMSLLKKVLFLIVMVSTFLWLL